MSLNGTMPPDSWVPDQSTGGMSQQVQQPNGSQPFQQQLLSPSPSTTPAPPHEDQLDRQMLRHLLRKYTPEDLGRLLQEENATALSHGETASVLTSSTYSSAKSDDAPSLFDSGSSICALSDTSSARGSIISNVSARTAKFLNRKSHSSRSSSQLAPSVTNDSSSTISQCDADGIAENGHLSTGGSKQKGTFECGFCKEEGLSKTCTRKNDLKRHIEDFHNTNAQWHCRQRGCGLVFDWQTVYKTHLKVAHGGSRMPLDDVKINMCPQTVFACGFERCIQVFEAASDSEASTTFKEYVAHVVKHLDEGSNSGEWNYSTRIRNLMRQAGVLSAWMNSPWPESERNRLTWNTQNSNILRKRLETRHLGDLRLLIDTALSLGSDPNQRSEAHGTFILPVQEECQEMVSGHANRLRIQVPPQPQVHSQQHTPTQQDQFSFKISRGNGVNPQLANYYASQRASQMYPARAPVRSGRSARPPVRTMPATTMPTQQQSYHTTTSNAFDPTSYYQQQAQQQMNPQQYALMSAGDGGIIADDLRSLRSMASNSTNNSGDIDMGDAQMMDTQYMNHPQAYSTAFVPTHGLQSPPPSDNGMKMEQPNFESFEQNY